MKTNHLIDACWHVFRVRNPISKQFQILISITSIVLVCIGYVLLANAMNTPAIPKLSSLINGFNKLIEHGWLVADLQATLTRYFIGSSIGIVIAVVLGMIMGSYPIIHAMFLPILSLFAKIPSTAMLALFFVFFGIDFELFIAMIGFGIVPILAQSIAENARYDVAQHYIDKAYTLGASHYEIVRCVIFPNILPKVIESIRLQSGPAMVALIAAEWMMADVGFGYRLKIQSRLIEMNVVYIDLLVLGVLGLIWDVILVQCRNCFCRWFNENKT